MILINLFPPELRKRKVSININPVTVALAAGILVDLLFVGGYFWLRSRETNAIQTKIEREGTLEEKKVLAAAVIELEGRIAEFKNRRDNILSLLNQKVFWAKTIDDFSNLLVGEWTESGFLVRAQELSINEAGFEKGKGSEPDLVRYRFRWRYKILGDKVDRSGDYIKSFFDTIQRSTFWEEYTFTGKPEDRYVGDRPRPNADIGKVVVDGNLDWERVKNATPPPKEKPKPSAPAPAPEAGN